MDKPQFKKIFLIASILIGITAAAVFSSIPLFVRSQYLEQLIVRTVKERTGFVPSFQEIRLSVFPTPILHINNFELNPGEGSNVPLIRADHASFRPSLFSLLIGKPELAHVVFNDTDIHYTWRDREEKFVKIFSFQDVDLNLWNLSPNRPIRFKIKGKFLSDVQNLQLEGTFGVDFKNFRVKDLYLKNQTSVNSVELSKLAAWWGAPLPVQFDKGNFSISMQLNKAEGSSELELKNSVNLEDVVYRISPKPVQSTLANYQLKFNAKIDLNSGALTFQDGNINTPFGIFDVETKMNVKNLAVDEMVVKSKALHLEALPQYFLSFADVLPVNLGFSGETGIDFFGKGSPELFMINFHVDLTNTTLNYSKYFSKTNGIPLFLGGDFKIIAARLLRGDFSLEFQGASMKGSLVGLDLASGDCELTILTNKFNVNGWEQYFPPLRQFQLSGGMKILTSLKGNYHFLDRGRFMNNISFDGLEARAANGAQIKNINGSLDFGPTDAELHDIQFEIGNTVFLVQGKMLQQPENRWLIGIQVPSVDPVNLVSQLHKIVDVTQTGLKINWDSLEHSLAQVFGQNETLEHFETQIALSKDQFVIPFLRISAFGGNASAGVVVKNLSTNPETTVEFEFNRLNLARMQGASEKPILYGNLFGLGTLTNSGPFDGTWVDRLNGKGSISVTNGELRNIDILAGLSDIAELASLNSFKSGTTHFNDIRGDFQVEDKKITTDNMLMVSDDFEINGAGDVSFEGNLNFRLSVFLSPALSQRISPGLGENLRLGPIPILIAGPIGKPIIRKDPMLIGTFLQSLVQQQFSRITSRFTPPQTQTGQSPPTDQTQNQTSPTGEPQPKKSSEQALMESGFNLLEDFLSKKKTSS